MFQKTGLILLCATVCSAQTAGPVGAPAPPPPSPSHPPALTTTAAADDAPHYLTHCAPGDLIPGPTCTSFLMCVGGRTFATRRFQFECGPGTIFSADLGTCIHGYGAQCLPGGPSPPPGSLPTPTPAPCPPYELDPTSVFECLEPGHYPSLEDCLRFYKCIVTMDCILKGFMFSCPAGYAFDRRTKWCLREELLGRCDRVADAGALTFQIQPVVEIQPESFDEFFQADVYWNFMGFLPNETQKIVPVQPSAFARGSAGDLSMTQN